MSSEPAVANMANLTMGIGSGFGSGGGGGGVDPLGGAPRFCGDKTKFSGFRTRLVAWLVLANGPGGRPLGGVIRQGVGKDVADGAPVVGVSQQQREYLYHLLVLLGGGAAASHLEAGDGSNTDGLWAFWKLQEFANPSRGQPRIAKILSLLKTRCADNSATGVKAYLDEKRKLSRELKSITMKELLVAGCLSGLGEEYRVIKDSLLSRGLEHLSVDIIEVAVLDKADAVDTEMQICEGLAATTSNNKGSNVQCGYCGKQGHFLLECRKRTFDQGGNKHNNNSNNNKQNVRDDNAGEKGSCWVCGSTQHQKADCPKRKQQHQQGSKLIPMVVDSGASHHMLAARHSCCVKERLNEKFSLSVASGLLKGSATLCKPQGNLWKMGVEFFSDVGAGGGDVGGACYDGVFCGVAQTKASKQRRHERFGHFWQPSLNLGCSCEACAASKGQKPSHKKERGPEDYKGKKFGDLVAWDHQGPMNVAAINSGARFALLGVDDFSSWSEVFCHKQKSANHEGLRGWCDYNGVPSRCRQAVLNEIAETELPKRGRPKKQSDDVEEAEETSGGASGGGVGAVGGLPGVPQAAEKQRKKVSSGKREKRKAGPVPAGELPPKKKRRKVSKETKENPVVNTNNIKSDFSSERFDHASAHPVSTPAVAWENKGELKGTFPFREFVGCCNYVMCCSRPDIALAVQRIARCLVGPQLGALHACRRLLKYLRGSVDRGVAYTPQAESAFYECHGQLLNMNVQEHPLVGFCDSNFADGSEPSGKATSGHVCYYRGMPVYWGSKLQEMVSLSSAEAEFLSVFGIVKKICNLRQAAAYINGKDALVVPIGCDNQSAIRIAKSLV
eukprot:gene281-305_t